MYGKKKPLVPRNGHILVVVIVARISGCANQKEMSLDDQVDHAKQIIAEMYAGPIEYRIIATTGKGERLDRPELAEIESLIRSRTIDVLIGEDVGRLVRGTEAVRLIGIAVDHEVRVIAPNDYFDTADESWQEDAISASRDHVGHNSHTSKRIKHKLMNRFMKFGGAPARPIYGYIVPEGAKTYGEWKKDENAIQIFKEWFRLLRNDPNCCAVADWLNDQGVHTGPYARRKTWDGKMVRRITQNTLLKGFPGRGFTKTVKNHEEGRWKAVPNPDGPIFKDYPHLAHFDPFEWDEVNDLLTTANKGFGRKPVNGVDPLTRVPRNRTRFPGQHAKCWYCGRTYVWGGNGVTENLMCPGSRERKCWNSTGFNGAMAAERVMAAITSDLYRLEGFDDQFRRLVAEAGRGGGADADRHWADLSRIEANLAKQKANLMATILEFGPKPMFRDQLAQFEAAELENARTRRRLENSRNRLPVVPGTVAALKASFEEKFLGLAAGSPEFGNALRLVVPEFHVYLVRLCDGGHPLARAQLAVDLSGVAPDARRVAGLGELLSRRTTIDLFEAPQRERIRLAAARLAAEGVGQRAMAGRLPEPATQAAVSNALALDRQMRVLGLTSPYVVVTEPPADYPKLRRHLHPRYRFEPVPGYQPPEI
jgi:hypothetical protein